MTITAAKLQVVVDADTRGAESGLSSFGQKMGGIGGIVSNALGFFTGQLMTNALGSVKALGTEALGAYAEYERLGMSLQSLVARELVNTGQATDLSAAMKTATGTAEDLQGWIQKLAISSPFTQSGVADAFKTAMAYGFTTTQAQRLTTAMIDFAAGSGATESSMNTIALALGQIQAKGKLSGQEVLQLVNAGVAVDQILAKAMGKTTAEIVTMREKGLIPANDAIEIITKSLETDFGGAAARQAGTFSGLISSLSDIKSVGLREFFSGTFKTIQPMVTDFVNIFSDPKTMESIRGMGEKVGSGISQIITFVQGAIPQIQGFFASISENPMVQTILENLQLAFSNIAAFWQQNGGSITATIQSTFGKLVEIGTNLAQQVLPWISEQIAVVSQWFVDNGPLIAEFTQVLGDAFARAWEIIAAAWSWIQPILEGLIQTVLGIGKAIMQMVTGDWTAATETLKSTASTAWEFIKTAFENFANWVTTQFLGVSWASVKKTLKEDWEMLQEIGRLLWQKVIEKWNEAKDTLKGWVDDLSTKFNNFMTDILTPFKLAWEGISTAVQGVIKFVKELFAFLTGKELPGWAQRHSPSPIEQTFGGWLDSTRELVREIPRLNNALGSMTPVMAGVGNGYQGMGTQQNNSVVVNASVSSDIDLYNLAKQVSEEIRRYRL